jgi:hypothetical protein
VAFLDEMPLNPTVSGLKKMAEDHLHLYMNNQENSE